MKDETKTQKQLIAELAEMRQQRAVERASERIREAVLSMRSSDDLVKVVTALFREIITLSLKPVSCVFHFLDEEADRIVIYGVMEHPRKYGISISSFEHALPGMSEIDEDIIGGGGGERTISQFRSDLPSIPADFVERWRAGKVWSHKEVASAQHYKDALRAYPELRGHPFFTEDGIVTHVSFPYGTVAIKQEASEHAEEHVVVVQTLTEALSLGYLRFLDFQRLEEQTEQARRERAVERVRAEAMAMRSSDDLLKVVAAMFQEMLHLHIEIWGCNICFVDEKADQVIGYYAQVNPKKFGIPWTSPRPPWVEFDEEVAVRKNIYAFSYFASLDVLEGWHEKKVWSFKCIHTEETLKHDIELMGGGRLSPSFLQEYLGEWIAINVPFEYGFVGFREREYHEDHVTIVQELTDALSLGYLRFLDFQKVDEAQRQLIDELEEELQTAHDMQMRLMPTESPQVEGFDIAGRCLPANHVGGDLFQYFPLDGKLAVSMADVTGHAMEAAIPVVMFSGILESQIEIESSLEELFNRLNRTLHKTLMDSRTFVCFTMGELNIVNRFFRLSNGGCPYPFHFKAASKEIIELQVDAYPLGVRSDTSYQAIEVQLQTGDYIVFFSDGIIEAANETEEIFGFERTAERIRKGCTEDLTAEALIEQTIAEVKTFSGETPQIDDMTMVVLRVEQEEEIRVEKR